MTTVKTISIEVLAEKLGGKLWIKGNIKRIYLDRGYNTKKMSTKTYVYQREDGSFGVSCYIDCPSQPYQWIQSQQAEVIEGVERSIEKALATVIYVIKKVNGNYVGGYRQHNLNDADVFYSKTAAQKTIDEDYSDDCVIEEWDREKFEVEVDRLEEIERNLSIVEKLQRGDDISFHNLNPVEKVLEELKNSKFDLTRLTGVIHRDRSGHIKLAKENEVSFMKVLEESNSPIPDQHATLQQTETPDYSIDLKVKHGKFGIGVVTAESKTIVEVVFDTVGKKHLLKAYAKLEKI